MKNKKGLIIFLVIWFSLGVVGFVWGLMNSECCSLFSGVEEEMDIQYTNTEYGFVFDLPKDWERYSVSTSTWEGMSILGESGEGLVATGTIVTLRSPLWTESEPRQDIPIMVFTLEQWESLGREEFHVGAAPINPSELGRNDSYVFALPARYNFAFPEGFEEVDEIMRGKPLRGV
jgi:hypothetical protein